MDVSGQPGDCGPYTPPVQQGSASRDAKIQAEIKAADAAGLWYVNRCLHCARQVRRNLRAIRSDSSVVT